MALAAASADSRSQTRVELLLASGLAWCAALIHLQAAADHFGEYVPYAASFIVLALAQLAWGAALYRRPGRRLLLAGALGSLAVAIVWVLSRTTGLPLGPDARAPETVGLLDSIATLDELALCALAAVVLLRAPTDQPGRAPQRALRASALLCVLASSLVLGGGLHAH